MHHRLPSQALVLSAVKSSHSGSITEVWQLRRTGPIPDRPGGERADHWKDEIFGKEQIVKRADHWKGHFIGGNRSVHEVWQLRRAGPIPDGPGAEEEMDRWKAQEARDKRLVGLLRAGWCLVKVQVQRSAT